MPALKTQAQAPLRSLDQRMEALKRANDWTAQKLGEYGLQNVHLEPWKFGQAWTRGPISVRMTAPHERWLDAWSWAWAPGTKGPVAGDVVWMNATTRADFDARFAGKVRGKWVMTRAAADIWNPDGPPMTHGGPRALRAATCGRRRGTALRARPRPAPARHGRAGRAR